MFDGKIGIWPFAEVVKAKWSSKNRPKGTPELKPILRVKKETIRKKLFENVLLAISRKWPRSKQCQETPGVVIQLDTAGPHLSPTDNVLLEETKRYTNVKISFEYQPAMSPDLNVLDLRFFNSLQTSQLYKLATIYVKNWETMYLQHFVIWDN